LGLIVRVSGLTPSYLCTLDFLNNKVLVFGVSNDAFFLMCPRALRFDGGAWRRDKLLIRICIALRSDDRAMGVTDP
jgi:hypothetical protein